MFSGGAGAGVRGFKILDTVLLDFQFLDLHHYDMNAVTLVEGTLLFGPLRG